jgi:hypothetical protein
MRSPLPDVSSYRTIPSALAFATVLHMQALALL